MYAITIRQPWASLIMAGIKTLETRSRATKIRGRVLIHSALYVPPGPFHEIEGLVKKLIREMKDDAGDLGHVTDFYNTLPRGKILGSVELTDCLPAGDWVETHKGKGDLDRHAIYEREFALGDLSSNMFCWVLKDPQPWPRPFPFKGKQGFWQHPGGVIGYGHSNELR